MAKKPEPPPKDTGRVLFLSLNMILLAFFILLVALSNTDKTKEAEVAFRVRQAFQSFGGTFLGLGANVDNSGIRQEVNLLENAQQVESFIGVLNQFVEENDEEQTINFEVRSSGTTINIAHDFLFQPGSARLNQERLPFINGIITMIARTTNDIRIEGHTDRREERSAEYPDAWALSAARAATLFRTFTAGGQLATDRFSVVGYGAEQPIADNLTEEGRRQNRRVAVVFEGRLMSPQGL